MTHKRLPMSTLPLAPWERPRFYAVKEQVNFILTKEWERLLDSLSSETCYYDSTNWYIIWAAKILTLPPLLIKKPRACLKTSIEYSLKLSPFIYRLTYLKLWVCCPPPDKLLLKSLILKWNTVELIFQQITEFLKMKYTCPSLDELLSFNKSIIPFFKVPGTPQMGEPPKLQLYREKVQRSLQRILY